MLNIQEIENTITQLEEQDTSFAVCSKLADLYTVRNYYNNRNVSDDIEKEYLDIQTAYDSFCSIKKDYQLGIIPMSVVLSSMKALCKEVNEFLLILYRNTDSQDERDIVVNMIQNTLERLA